MKQGDKVALWYCSGNRDENAFPDPMTFDITRDTSKHLGFGAGGVQNIATRWYGPDDSQIYQMNQTYSQQGAYYVGFTVSKSGPWAAGSYRADIYTNDSPQPVRSVSYKVIP